MSDRRFILGRNDKVNVGILEFLCKIRHFVPLEILKALYFSLFYSFVSHGIAVGALPTNHYLTLLL